MQDWNRTARAYPRARGVHQLFAEQAARTPEAPALVWTDATGADRTLTYGELEARANQLAHHLRARGIGADPERQDTDPAPTLVAICLERSPELVIAQLAILKAGAAYLPLDPAYPNQQLA
ncbi:AMP-binding protein, partial [Novosphingobium sp. Leaf2]|uniref:AMP-binding protein n=1 Tax=Novosphingobium sp. Leaf2 TaxID=1735670 RepID=UPI001F175339